jgi:hypothetical protein
LLTRNVVGIATGYQLDDRGLGVRVQVGSRIFTSPYRPDLLWADATYYPLGTEALAPGVKRQEREADHSYPTSAEIKKTTHTKSSIISRTGTQNSVALVRERTTSIPTELKPLVDEVSANFLRIDEVSYPAQWIPKAVTSNF